MFYRLCLGVKELMCVKMFIILFNIEWTFKKDFIFRILENDVKDIYKEEMLGI